MISLERANRLIDSGLSIITVGDEKTPNFPWKISQTEIIDKDKFEKQYNSKSTKALGIVTGFNNLEALDIDLKIFPSLKMQQDFWNEYLQFLKDNIDDFDDKFVIYKTVSGGYHIIYRCEVIGGNKKVAKLKEYKEALIETRGTGGYIFVYENNISKKDYTQIQEISVLDRDVLFSISETYNYKGDEVIDIPKDAKEPKENEVTPWDDYNDKNSANDLISDGFDIIRNLSDKYVIRRHGATSPHSGYIYKDSGCMFLFTTGTIYPNEKLLSPFSIYAIKYCNGDYSEAAKEIYSKGFGTRHVKKIEFKEEKIEIKNDDLIFPIDIFPSEVQHFIMESHRTLNMSIDYMACSFLWVISVIVGNSLNIEVKRGWNENSLLWLCLVGRAGVGKTPSIDQMIKPIIKVNAREIKKYIKEYKKYLEYEALDKKEKEYNEEIKQPKKTQFIVNDITLESLVDVHEENKNAIGVFKDELAGWFKDMNKYRAGSDLEFWLSSWSGKGVSMNRKTAKSSFVERPFVPVLGGIQPSIFDLFQTEENKESGFNDRMLISYPDLTVDKYNDDELDEELIDWYSEFIISFYDVIKKQIIRFNNDDEIEPMLVKMNPESKAKWKVIFNELTNKQNSDIENEFMKSMLPKQKSYVPRFALLINTINSITNEDYKINLIHENSMDKADKLSKYFINMAKKVKVDSMEKAEIKETIVKETGKSKFEQFKVMYAQNNDIKKTYAAELLNVSRRSIHNYISKINEL